MEILILKGIAFLLICTLIARINVIFVVIKISLLGEFEHWRKISWSLFSNKIHVRVHYGYKQNPESVSNWEFDVYRHTAHFWKSYDFENITIFNGSLDGGLEIVLSKKNILFAGMLWFLKTALICIFVTIAILSLVIVFVSSFSSDFNPSEIVFSTDYPFWWKYTHHFLLFTFVCIVASLISILNLFLLFKWKLRKN